MEYTHSECFEYSDFLISLKNVSWCNKTVLQVKSREKKNSDLGIFVKKKSLEDISVLEKYLDVQELNLQALSCVYTTFCFMSYHVNRMLGTVYIYMFRPFSKDIMKFTPHSCQQLQ
jgi:hypothetical protein